MKLFEAKEYHDNNKIVGYEITNRPEGWVNSIQLASGHAQLMETGIGNIKYYTHFDAIIADIERIGSKVQTVNITTEATAAKAQATTPAPEQPLGAASSADMGPPSATQGETRPGETPALPGFENCPS